MLKLTSKHLLILTTTILVCFGKPQISNNIVNVHLAMTGNPSEMVVSWLTSDDSPSVVVFGTDRNLLNNTANGTSNSYSSDAGYNHNVLLQGLKRGTQYFYQCGDGNSTWTDVFFFTTEVENPVPFTIGIYGDMGITESNHTRKRLFERLANNQFDFIWHLGDISYADDHLEFEPTWNEWFELMSPLLPYIPYMTTVGNHEHACNIAQSCFFTKVNYNSEGLSQGQLYYSFDYGNVHFISLSTESDFPNSPYGGNGNQVAWLEEDLKKANANRQNVPWIFVGGHRPIYSSAFLFHFGNQPLPDSLFVQEAFEDLFQKYRVDIFFTGHVHLYERQYPTYNDNPVSTSYVNPEATIHIISGGSGNIEGLNYFDIPVPSWHAFGYNQDQGYGMLTIFNNTHLNWEYFRSSDGQLVDSVVIVQENH